MLETKDLESIQEIVLASEERMRQHVKEVVLASEDRVVTRINREVTDLAEINRAVIAKVSVIPELQHRLDVIERRLGIV